MKKIFAVLMALTLILSLSVATVCADEVKEWTGSITIEGTANVPVAGKTFAAYKVLDAVAVDADDLDAGVLYSIPAALQTIYDDLCGGEDGVATVDEVTAYINANTDTFAATILAEVKDKDIVTSTNSTIIGDKAVISGLDFGYYVIEDKGTATPISALMLKSTSATVKVKADKPDIDKAIDGDADADVTTDDLVDYNTAKVGDVVPYVLTSKVPDMTGYTTYTYTVTDTFSAGLTFNYDEDNLNDAVEITIGGVAYNDYTVAVNGQVLTITFNNFINQAENKGDAIVIKYSATVNENAVFGVEGNPNTVYLTYSNNPQENTTENTVEDVVRTYLVDLVINKVDGNDTPLQGAKFDLEDADGNVIASGESDANGLVVFTWVDGVKGLRDKETYTIVETQAPAGYNKADDITFQVICTDPAANAENQKCAWSTDNTKVTFDTTDNRLESTIQNLTGWLLPETGGIGTTIFYVVGGLMMVFAGIVLVSKKRMGSYT